jgi:hypothetical protein
MRKQPYTEAGIKRVKCFRCGSKAHFQWNICSDGNVFRPICIKCDVELNRLVLRFMRFPDWKQKADDYKFKKINEIT